MSDCHCYAGLILTECFQEYVFDLAGVLGPFWQLSVELIERAHAERAKYHTSIHVLTLST